MSDALEDALLGGVRRYRRDEVAERAGIATDRAREMWRALGFVDVGDDEVAFTDRDVDALRIVRALADRGLLTEENQLGMTRALGQALARLAEWQVAAVTDALAAGGTDAEEAAVADELVPLMERLITYVWRRHLAAVAGRMFADGADAQPGVLAVGFADLVGFTSLTRHVDEDELGALVERFERLASDVIAARGARVVKTVGDEVMFVADDGRAAADVALDLLDAVAAADVPDVRIGVACGPVLARLGDVFGEPVNLASRLTSIARPGSVLVDRELAAVLGDDDRFRLSRVTPRPVRGYALLHAFRLRRRDLGSAS